MFTDLDPIDAAATLISLGIEGLVQTVIDQVQSAPLINAEADFNRSLMLRSPIVSNQSNPFDISLPASGHPILIPNQISPIINPFLLNKELLPMAQTNLVLKGNAPAISDIDLTINNIKLLAQVDWNQITKIKNSGKPPAVKALGFNKDVLVKILRDLGYKVSTGAKAMKREAVVDKLLEYKRAYDNIIKNNPQIQQLLLAQASQVES